VTVVNASTLAIAPVLALLFAASFWGVVWYPSRILEGMGMHGAWLVLVSYAAAFLVFTPFVRFSLRGLRRQPWEALMLVLSAGWTNVAFVLAVLEGEVVRVVLLFYLSPIWTVLLGRWLLHELLDGYTWVMLGLGIGGAAIMLWDPVIEDVPLNRADLLAASAGLAFAVNNVMTRRITEIGIRAKTHLAWFGVIIIATLFVWFQSPVLPDVAPSAWAGAIALGIGGFMLSTLAVVYGVSNMPVQRSAVIMLFELIVGAVSAWLLAAEMISLQEWVGGALIISAAMIAIFKEGLPV
jgi:drug/metabolite transporter (DMT)-like permease